MDNKQPRNYKLDKLIEYIGNEEDVLKDMIGIFLNTTPDLIDEMNKGLQAESYDIIGKNAHKLKPTLDIFGIQSLHEIVRTIELLAAQQKNMHKISSLIEFMENTLNTVYLEIKEDYNM